jgi:flagellar protein FliS
MTPALNARRAYNESAVLTASPEQLVVMLYDGAIRSLRQSAEAMRRGERERARSRMRAGEGIIDELNNSLDMRHGEIPSRLRSIYFYCKRRLIHANVHGDPDAIDTVVELLSDLREAWHQILQSSELQTA